LKAHRVDLSRTSDSIITEIVLEIAQCRLVIADVTTIGELANRAIRNGNVLYEVGLAHASRLPQEVILLRSDKDTLDFDIAGVRVHTYDPDEPVTAQKQVRELLEHALKSIELDRAIAVQHALRSLDFAMYVLLQNSIQDIPHPAMTTFADVVAGTERLNAIYRLLNAGMLCTEFRTLTPDLMAGAIPIESAIVYKSTEFGRTVFAAAREQQGFASAFIDWIKTPNGKSWHTSVSEQIKGISGDTGL